MSKPSQNLPIEALRTPLTRAAAKSRRLIIQSPTGSGKSTQVPQMLIDEGLVQPDQKVVVLQPRRIAARMLSRRVASERSVAIGGEVGYSIRFDSKTSRNTRIEFVTEGILFRRMMKGDSLADTGAIIFDEFHERHLYGDIGLAMAKELQQTKRKDLLLAVMSATLDTEGLSEWFAPCETLISQGREFPVTVEYSAAQAKQKIWDGAAAHFNQLAKEEPEGDFLIFMPGADEIRRTVSAIQKLATAKDFDVFPLYGELSPEAQDAAVLPGPKRKVVVATNVAETSLTIEGVRVVIDSGLARMARYDAHRGLNTLWIEPISQASAQQRTGRAGRVAPGRCLRMWGQRQHESRPPQHEAEIQRVDLAEIYLGMLAGCIQNLDTFDWFEKPDDNASHRAWELLKDLGAVDNNQQLTSKGRKLAEFPLHPRYACMLMQAQEERCMVEATLLAALCQGRPMLLRSDRRIEQARDNVTGATDSDAVRMVLLWQAARKQNFSLDYCKSLGVHAGAARQAGQAAAQFSNIAKAQGLDTQCSYPDEGALARCLLAGFSDRVGKRQDKATRRVELVHGRRGELQQDSIAYHSQLDLLVAAEIDEVERRGELSVLLGMVAPVETSWLVDLYPHDFTSRKATLYDPVQKRVEARQQQLFRDLPLAEKVCGEPDTAEAARLLAQEALAGRIELKRWNHRVGEYIRRIAFAAKNCPELEIEPIDESAKQMLLEEICLGAFSQKEVREREVMPVVRGWLRADQQAGLEAMVPEEIPLPCRNRPFPIEYAEDGSSATLSAKIQDFYGVKGESLRIGGGQIPLRLQLLAPNNRPIQITTDIDAFWANSYPEVKKQLKGRYPKHKWI